jgi:hypothetical protein
MKSAYEKQKVKTGINIVIALTMGAMSVISPNISTLVVKAQVPQLSSKCSIVINKQSNGIIVRTTCYQVRVSVKCSNGLWYYASGSAGRPISIFCPSGTKLLTYVVQYKKCPTCPWVTWPYI